MERAPVMDRKLLDEAHGEKMDLEEIRHFFDVRADSWDTTAIPDPAVIREIFAEALPPGAGRVLDVACGTGVLVPFYRQAAFHTIVGVDLSPRMIARAKAKFQASPEGSANRANQAPSSSAEPAASLTFLCADVESLHFQPDFDLCMIYNALPHFRNFERLFRKLRDCLRSGGRLCVAHGRARAAINATHHSGAGQVSQDLPPVGELAGLAAHAGFRVRTQRSSDRYYLLVAEKCEAWDSGSDRYPVR